jgi:hypothetical protein
MEKVLPFFVNHAPERLPLPASWPDPAESPVKFAMRTLSAGTISGAPAVSHVRLTDFDGDGHLDALITEMQQGVLLYAPRISAARDLTVLASLPHPDHVTPIDLDKDGVQDLLVADLGEFPPFDHDHGAVIWLRGIGNGKFGAMWLDGWPRVADVEAGDFNDDGKPISWWRRSATTQRETSRSSRTRPRTTRSRSLSARSSIRATAAFT